MLPTTKNKMQMTSLEIAELVNSRHDVAKKSIERLAGRGVIVHPPLVDEPDIDAMGRTRYTQVYVFVGEQGKRDSIVVVAQLSPEFTARLVDRWQELEAQQAITLPNFNNPAEAARAWANEFEAKQQAVAQLEQAKPKIEHYNRVVDRCNLLNATQVGQKVGLSGIALNKMLDQLGVYNKTVKRSRVFQQWFIDKGLGIVKQTDLGYTQALFTTKGEAWVIERLTSEGVA